MLKGAVLAAFLKSGKIRGSNYKKIIYNLKNL